jgi:D-alanine-D-alanine ligase
MQKKIKIGVLIGGRSGEHDVSLISSRSILSVLSQDKYTITPIGITRRGKWVTYEGHDVIENVLHSLETDQINHLTEVTLLPNPQDNLLYAIRRQEPQGSDTKFLYTLESLTDLDVIFPILHGTFSEDGTLQGLLEMADMAYVGAGVLASSVAMDKGLFKEVMRANNISVLESIVVTRTQIETQIDKVLEDAVNVADFPLFVKPCNLGSSVGVSKCSNRSDLLEGVLDAARYDRRILIERGINGREIEVSVLGNDNPKASVPGEIVPSDEFYSYDAKYVDDNSELVIPANLDVSLIKKIQDIATRIYKAVDCAGMARADFLLDKDSGALYVNEINTIPGFTQISMYPKLWEASGLPYSDLLDDLIELALERKSDRDNTEREYRR